MNAQQLAAELAALPDSPELFSATGWWAIRNRDDLLAALRGAARLNVTALGEGLAGVLGEPYLSDRELAYRDAERIAAEYARLLAPDEARRGAAAIDVDRLAQAMANRAWLGTAPWSVVAADVAAEYARLAAPDEAGPSRG